LESNLEVILGLGSNIGDRAQNLEDSIEELNFQFGKFIQRSSIYESLPVDYLDQDLFLNMVIMYTIDSKIKAIDFLEKIQSIERKLGRIKTIPKGPRSIDIDILYFSNEEIKSKNLVIPHPGIMRRDFVIYPLQELTQSTRKIKIPTPHQSLKNNLKKY